MREVISPSTLKIGDPFQMKEVLPRLGNFLERRCGFEVIAFQPWELVPRPWTME
jgi:hypothetical protein